MINKSILQSVISKYYLNVCESVKWKTENNNLTIDFMSPTADIIGKVTCKDFPLEDSELAIYDTNPKAFAEDNVNTLIKNKNLKIPSIRYFENHTHLEARKILRDHNNEWKNVLKKIKKDAKPKKIKKLKVIDNKDSDKKIKQLVNGHTNTVYINPLNSLKFVLNKLKKDKITLDKDFYIFTGSTVGVTPILGKGVYQGKIDKLGSVKAKII